MKRFMSILTATIGVLCILTGCAKEIDREELRRWEAVESDWCTYSCTNCYPSYNAITEMVEIECDYSCDGRRDAQKQIIEYMVYYDDETKKTKQERHVIKYLSECK